MHDHSLTNIRPVCTLKFIPNDSNRETLNKRVNDLHDNLRKRITNGRSFLKGKGVGRGWGGGQGGKDISGRLKIWPIHIIHIQSS